MNRSFSRLGALGLLSTAALATAPAMAAAVDVSAVVTDITAQAVPVGLIGAGVLVLLVGIKAFQWIRKAMA